MQVGRAGMLDPNSDVMFTPKWRRGVRGATWVLCSLVLVGAVTADWDAAYGRPTVLSGVRPALARALTHLVGRPERADAVPPGGLPAAPAAKE